MKVLGIEKIKENLIKSGLFELKKEWKNKLIFAGISIPYEISINIYGDSKKCFDVSLSNVGKFSDKIIDIKSNIDLVMNNVEEFKIGTLSIGDITVKECEDFIGKYKLALEITSKLNSIFFEQEKKQKKETTKMEMKKILVKDDDVNKVVEYCIDLINLLDKDCDIPNFEDVKDFMLKEDNQEEYLLWEYDEKEYSYTDHIIDLLDEEIRYS